MYKPRVEGIIRACDDDIVIPFSALRPYLTKEGKRAARSIIGARPALAKIGTHRRRFNGPEAASPADPSRSNVTTGASCDRFPFDHPFEGSFDSLPNHDGKVTLTAGRSGAIEGTYRYYRLKNANGDLLAVDGKLDECKLNAKRGLRCRWHDLDGTGPLIAQFSDDYKQFWGGWTEDRPQPSLVLLTSWEVKLNDYSCGR